MNTPPFLMFGALVLWGWQTGILLPAILMGGVLEASRLISTRWVFTQKEYNRIWDLCCLLFAIAAMYCYATVDGDNIVVEFLKSINWTERNAEMDAPGNATLYFYQWWPMALFPFACAQAYGSRRRHPMQTFFYMMRRKKKDRDTSGPGINTSYIYFALCLVAAGSSVHRDLWYYSGISVLCSWALLAERPRRLPLFASCGLVAVVILGGYVTQERLRWMQTYLEGSFNSLLNQWSGRSLSDSAKSRTAIGHLGRLKLSNRIAWRLETTSTPPKLIRDSSFTTWSSPVWYVGKVKDFTSVVSEVNGTTWKLATNAYGGNVVSLSGYGGNSPVMLPVPNGSSQLLDLIAEEVLINQYGAVRVSGTPGILNFDAQYGPRLGVDSPPDETDLLIPISEKAVIESVAADLNLASVPLEEKLRRVFNYFQQEFRYTTWQGPDRMKRRPRQSALTYFLTESKAGHCEYFGTAAALLLRAGGVSTRYANGYAVHEERSPGQYVIRDRDAHAWTLYWSEKEGRWVDFDTTPGDWLDHERKANGSLLQPLSDFFSDLKHSFLSWWYSARDNSFQKYLAGVLVVLVMFLFYRLIARRRRKKSVAAPLAQHWNWPGLDSEFYRVEKQLEERGLMRHTGEPQGQWLHRLRDEPALRLDLLGPILHMHYRYRFDPVGIGPAERERLRRQVEEWQASQAKVVEENAADHQSPVNHQ